MADERKAPEDRQARQGHTPEEREALLKARRRLYEMAAESPDEEDGK